MKKLLILTLLFLALFGSLTVHAAETEYDLSGVYDSLSEDAKRHLLSIGADSAQPDSLSALSFDGMMKEIASMAQENIRSPLRGLISVTAMLLLCSMLTAYRGSLSADTGTALELVLSLCLSAAVALPASAVITSIGEVITRSSQLMLAYVPVMALLLTASGSLSSSAAYYAAVVGAGEGVVQLSSGVVLPFLRMLLGMSIASGVSGGVDLSGFTASVSKAAKWLLAFVMAVFTAVLGLKQVVAGSLDSVTGKAARFAVSSFVPVVGAALSEALRTLQSSLGVLKSGIGVFVILALAVTFLPAVLRVLLWLLTLWAGKAMAEALNLSRGAGLLNGISDVFSVMLAVLLSVGAAFIIAAAAVFSIGGAS